MNETHLIRPEEDITPTVNPSNTSSVRVEMNDTMGALFLGILAWILLIGWMRAETRCRTLITRLHADS